MERLALFDAPLAGLNLIEASAGTGKTFAISGLYLRMVVELGLPVEQILVVTYTKAATAELRERIRALLVQAKAALETGRTDDTVCRGLLEHCVDHDTGARRLGYAILSFDRAAIFTIHGFCQRVLADTAFESAMPFEIELVTDQSLLVQEVVDDFWRLRIQDLSPGLIDYLLASGFSPDSLAAQLRGQLGRSYLELRGCREPHDLAGLEQRHLTLFNSLRDLWWQERETLEDLLVNNTGLNGNKYRKASIPGWLRSMDGYLGASPGPWFEQFGKFCASTLVDSLKKGGQPPEHPLFPLCDTLLEARRALDDGYHQARVALLEALIRYTDCELRSRKAARRMQFYDDLLINLQQALGHDREGLLAARIRTSYRAALIDEFQDTDPVQYGIFKTLYHQSGLPVFLVGDPKQAIYSFRGADLFAYLGAALDADTRYTLDLNWRSTPKLLNGINTLFSQIDRSFFYSNISYHCVTPGKREIAQLSEPGGESAALNIGLLPGPHSKESALEQSVAACAAEIARLLALAGRGEARIGGRALAGSDIAVLVRSHRQGSRIGQALMAFGIHSVQRSQADVFHTPVAVNLERLLKAVAEPGREALVRAALATDIMGVDGNRLQQITGSEHELERLLDAFREYHRLWREQGFVGMFRQLLVEQGVAVRLLQHADGERRLTNLLHLGELLHQRERAGRPGMELLLSWFSSQCRSDRPGDEETQLRLESDEQLVQIVTIHKSKGLQYPVVFYPFGWDGGVRAISKNSPYSFHDPRASQRAVLELGSPRWEEDQIFARQEEMAEGLRLLYVALTRAEQRCYLYWGNVNGAGLSALAWLLHPPPEMDAPDAFKRMETGFKSLGDSGLRDRLEKLLAQSQGSIALSDLPQAAVPKPMDQIPAPPVASLEPRRFRRSFSRERRVTSFSALAGGHGAVELPDHDMLGETLVEEPVIEGVRDIFHFPRGARPGSCLHAIFERLDLHRHSEQALETLVQQQLDLHGIEQEWTSLVSQMVQRVLATPLDAGGTLRLGSVPRDRCLVELGFYYPLQRISAPGLSRLLLEHDFAGDGEILRAVERLSFREVRGFMKGFIDLIFQAEGRFYLLDYKSNWLGNDLAAYGQPQLAAAMARESYYLQYLLYTLALHRYLGRRLAGYRYQRHFGGVFYLFLRGMEPAAGPDFGVYRARPDQALIEALDRFIGKPDREPL